MKGWKGALLFFGSVYLISKLTLLLTRGEVDTFERKIRNEFTGIVTGKRHYRGNWIYFRDQSGRRMEITSVSSELYEKALEGDTLKKLAKTNKCMLVRGDSVYRITCYALPESIKEQIRPLVEE